MRRKLSDTVQLKLRFSEELRRHLRQAAKGNRHSMNAEIVDRLEKSFLFGNLAELMRGHIDTAVFKAVEKATEHAAATAEQTAIRAAEQVVQQLKNRGSDNDKAS